MRKERKYIFLILNTLSLPHFRLLSLFFLFSPLFLSRFLLSSSHDEDSLSLSLLRRLWLGGLHIDMGSWCRGWSWVRGAMGSNSPWVLGLIVMGFVEALGLLWCCSGDIGFTVELGSSDLGQRYRFHGGLCLNLSFGWV